jgi:ribosomal 30S subunit maturation factor RimM
MAFDLSTVQTGMDVLDPGGDKIGTVSDILDVQAYNASDTDTAYADATTGIVSDYDVTTVTPTGEQQYLKVKHGGLLGIGAEELYVPLSAVQNIVPGESVTINCTKDTCGDVYGTKPAALS